MLFLFSQRLGRTQRDVSYVLLDGYDAYYTSPGKK